MLSWKDFTLDIRKKALGYLVFLKGKQSRKMKGRGCADGRPQRECITKDESSSLTVSLYTLMGFCIMDALNNRKNNCGYTWRIPTKRLATRRTSRIHNV